MGVTGMAAMETKTIYSSTFQRIHPNVNSYSVPYCTIALLLQATDISSRKLNQQKQSTLMNAKDSMSVIKQPNVMRHNFYLKTSEE